jgi:hypothetical protein
LQALLWVLANQLSIALQYKMPETCRPLKISVKILNNDDKQAWPVCAGVAAARRFGALHNKYSHSRMTERTHA